MSEPLVSILVPTYNAGPFLRQALDSLVEQRLTNIEIICINDGSTDESPQVLEEYARRDDRFVLHHKPNSGYGASMNVGLDLARGRYIGILEPDDYASPLMFEHLSQLALAHDAEVVKAGYRSFQTENGLDVQNMQLFRPALTGRVLRPLDHPEVFRARPAIWAGIYERDFLSRAGIRFLETPGASYQDAGFNFKVMAAARRAVFVNRHFLHYRTDNAASSVKDRGKIWAVRDEYESIAEYIRGLPDAQKLYQVMLGTRFESYRWNLERLDPEVRPEFFEHVVEAYSSVTPDVLVPEYFTGRNWEALQQIRSTPEVLREREHTLTTARDGAATTGSDTRGVDAPAETTPGGATRGLISVIIPVHNAERFLADCLDSVLTQSHSDLEVICVDDGSTDSSVEILRLYARRDPRVTVLEQPNSGAGVARNAGLAVARGEYISFLDADDVFDSRMLELAYVASSERALDVCVFRAAWFRSEERYVRRAIAHGVRAELLPAQPVFSMEDVPRDRLSLFQGWAWDKLFRADFVRENALSFQDLRTTNDLFFVFASLMSASRISVLPETLVYQRRAVRTSLSRTREASWDNYLKALRALREFLSERGVLAEWEQDFRNYVIQISLWNLDTLQGPSFEQLHNALNSYWLREFGILEMEASDFYKHAEYRKFERLTTLPAGAYFADDGPVESTATEVAPTEVAPTEVAPTGAVATRGWESSQGDEVRAPAISVIVAVYNASAYLRTCLDSVLAHREVDIEIVCVNDGSTDESREILREYAAEFDNIVVVDRENGGLSAARNSGLEVATGRYVIFLDSDDWLCAADMGAMVERATRDELDVLLYDARSFRDHEVSGGTWKRYRRYYDRSREYSVPTTGVELLARMRANHEYRVSACLYMVRRELLNAHEIRFVEGIVHEDNAFTFAVMVCAERAAHAQVKLYGRRVRSGSTTTGGTHLRSVSGYLGSYVEMIRLLSERSSDAPDVSAHLGGVVYSVLHNARHHYELAGRSGKVDGIPGHGSDPLVHLALQTMRRLR